MGMSGVTVNGLKYMFHSANDKVVRAKKGSSGAHIFRTTQAVIVSTYTEPIEPIEPIEVKFQTAANQQEDKTYGYC